MDWRRFLGRKPRQPEWDIQDSPDQWVSGDIAICCASGDWINICTNIPGSGPICGDAFLVRHVELHENAQMLNFSRSPTALFPACHFRKQRPQADEERAADAAFVQLIKPARQPAKAD